MTSFGFVPISTEFHEMRAEAQLAESLGFTGCYFTEHHQQPTIPASPLVLAAAMAVLSAAFPTASSAATTTKIMPLGDSITRGSQSQDTGGYRGFLETSLEGEGYDFDFVGSQTDYAGSGEYALTRKRHEGHSGYTINGIRNNINTWLTDWDPDVVLLMIGTNDRKASDFPDGAATRFEALVEDIQNHPTKPRLLASAIPPSSDSSINTKITRYNGLIKQISIDHGVPFVEPGLGLGDLADGVHPDREGYQKIAQAWFAALKAREDEIFFGGPTTSTTAPTTSSTSSTSTSTPTSATPPVLEANSSADTAATPVASKTLAHTVSGTNRYLVVGVAWAASPGVPEAATVTYAGQPLVQVGPTLSPGNVATRMALFALANPTTGTNNVVVSFPTNVGMVISARSFTGVAQASLGEPVSRLGTGTAVSADVPAGANDVVVDFAAHLGNSATANVGPGQTQDANRAATATNYDVRGMASRQAGSASAPTTMSWTLSKEKPWGTLAVALKPA